MLHCIWRFFMVRITLSLVVAFLLTGCAASDIAENAVITPKTVTVAQAATDGPHFYWYTFRPNQPITLNERVFTSNQGQYQASYRWRSGKLFELYQQGQQRVDGSVTPFSLQLRFDSDGLAVFQRYQQGQTIVPLTNAAIAKLHRQVLRLAAKVEQLSQHRHSWVQGHWQQQQFIPCQQQQAVDVIAQSSAEKLSGQGYMAVSGQLQQGQLMVDDILLQRPQLQCLVAPNLLKQ
ncbi:hypothetical protein AYY19_17155 [Photobacterium aquimaris]|uniref:DUF1481 domain-containing protein n=2 Tax=Photobacterium aquimaris TaxID=512643 RepID=A0A2T3IFG4_9GAMM|nr:hypothetical protein AYY19_17155 [Photobacterium aquimaris]OBU19929.1 hypothetical protein AYY20_17125 [Photobacterium aquimaris]PSU24921.1 DUF1481 domain-containing protein [Photobacterium aquimaris]PSV97462.1 DUF1481 domain-containing protein [Photobacterium aquimaris]